jgi:hypothetical protein
MSGCAPGEVMILLMMLTPTPLSFRDSYMWMDHVLAGNQHALVKEARRPGVWCPVRVVVF